MPSGKVASGAAARHYVAKRVPSGLVDRTVPADASTTFAAGSSLIADGARNGHCFTQRCGSYRLRECSMSPDALVLNVRRYSLMLRGYL